MRSPKETKVICIVILILALISFVMNFVAFGFGVALGYFVGSLGIISAILFANNDKQTKKNAAKHDVKDEKSDQK